LEPREEAEAFIRRWDSLQEFFAHWERNSEGDLAGTFNNYRNLEEFEELFREHFRDFLSHQVNQEVGREVSSRRCAAGNPVRSAGSISLI
jgi:hypothetical protein